MEPAAGGFGNAPRTPVQEPPPAGPPSTRVPVAGPLPSLGTLHRTTTDATPVASLTFTVIVLLLVPQELDPTTAEIDDGTAPRLPMAGGWFTGTVVGATVGATVDATVVDGTVSGTVVGAMVVGTVVDDVVTGTVVAPSATTSAVLHPPAGSPANDVNPPSGDTSSASIHTVDSRSSGLRTPIHPPSACITASTRSAARNRPSFTPPGQSK